MKIKSLLSVLSFFLLWGISFASVVISEVLVDGTDEFVELYNNSTSSFNGSIIIEWVKSSPLTLSNISIPVQGFYLLGDNGSMLQWLVLQKSWLSLNLTDTSPVNIILKDLSWNILDTFIVDQTTVTQYDNTKTSFQKISVDGIRSIQTVTSPLNAVTPFLIHPWRISITQTPVVIVETWSTNSGDTTSWNTNTSSWTTTTIIENTGSQLSWTNTTGTIVTGEVVSGTIVTSWENILIQTGDSAATSWILLESWSTTSWTSNIIIIDTTTTSSRVIISEIHPANDEYFKEYLELWFDTPYSGSLRIIGAGHGAGEKIIQVQQSAKSRIILWWEDFWFGNMIVNGLSLTDWGEFLTLVWQDWLVLDNVVYNWQVAKKSLYRWAVWDGWVTQMNYIDIMTPGYSKEQALHLLPSSSGYTLPCGIDFQNRTPRYAGTSMNIAGTRNNETISNSNTQFQCSRKIWNNIVSNVCNPNYMQLTGAIMDNLTLNVQYGTDICVHTIPLNIPLAVSSSSSSSPGSNYYHEYQIRRDKFNELLKSIKLLWFDLSTSKLLSLDDRVLSSSIILVEDTTDFSGSLLFDEILPNPEGKDNTETVRLRSSGQETIAWVYLSFENKVFPLATINLWDEIHSFTTGFSLPNDGSCIELKLWTKILDTLCYPKAKEGVWYSHDTQTEEWIILSGARLELFTLQQTKKEVCAYLDSKKILCEAIVWNTKDQKSLDSSIKKLEAQLKKKEKEITKLEKKLDKQETKIVKLTQKQKEIQASIKDIRVKYSQRREKKESTLVATRQKNSNLTQLLRLHTRYIGFLENLMYEERPRVVETQFKNFLDTRVMHSLLEDSLKQGAKKEFVVHPYIYGKSDSLLSLAHGDINEEVIATIYPSLYSNLVENVHYVQENIIKEEKNLEMVKLGRK